MLKKNTTINILARAKKELETVLMQEGYNDLNPPQYMQKQQISSQGVLVGIALLASVVIGAAAVSMTLEQSLTDDIRHDTAVETKLLEQSAEKLGISPDTLRTIYLNIISKNPEVFKVTLPEDATSIEAFKFWLYGPSGREIRARMDVKVLPALRAAVEEVRKHKESIASNIYRDPQQPRLASYLAHHRVKNISDLQPIDQERLLKDMQKNEYADNLALRKFNAPTILDLDPWQRDQIFKQIKNEKYAAEPEPGTTFYRMGQQYGG